MREIRTLRAMWRVLETELRNLLTGHEGGNAGYRQGVSYECVAPALDPTRQETAKLLPVAFASDSQIFYFVEQIQAIKVLIHRDEAYNLLGFQHFPFATSLVDRLP